MFTMACICSEYRICIWPYQNKVRQRRCQWQSAIGSPAWLHIATPMALTEGMINSLL